MKKNFNVFDFEIDPADMTAIRSLNTRTSVNFLITGILRLYNGWEA